MVYFKLGLHLTENSTIINTPHLFITILNYKKIKLYIGNTIAINGLKSKLPIKYGLKL